MNTLTKDLSTKNLLGQFYRRNEQNRPGPKAKIDQLIEPVTMSPMQEQSTQQKGSRQITPRQAEQFSNELGKKLSKLVASENGKVSDLTEKQVVQFLGELKTLAETTLGARFTADDNNPYSLLARINSSLVTSSRALVLEIEPAKKGHYNIRGEMITLSADTTSFPTHRLNPIIKIEGLVDIPVHYKEKSNWAHPAKGETTATVGQTLVMPDQKSLIIIDRSAADKVAKVSGERFKTKVSSQEIIELVTLNEVGNTVANLVLPPAKFNGDIKTVLTIVGDEFDIKANSDTAREAISDLVSLGLTTKFAFEYERILKTENPNYALSKAICQLVSQQIVEKNPEIAAKVIVAADDGTKSVDIGKLINEINADPKLNRTFRTEIVKSFSQLVESATKSDTAERK